MALIKRALQVGSLGLAFAAAFPVWSQTEQSNAERALALQKQLDELKVQMAAIEAQILELMKPAQPAVNTPTPPSAITSPTVSPAVVVVKETEQSGAAQAAELGIAPRRQVGTATATYETNSQDQIAAPRIDNAPLDPRYPGYFRLPGTLTLMRIGGYFKTDFIYDLKPPGDPDRFIPSTFPIPTPVAVNNTTVSVRPTRMNLDFLIPVSSKSVRFFIEFDLFGSNSTTPRLRHAYAQVANILVGQTFSGFMDPDAGPDTLDAQGPNSQVLLRNPQFRYTIPLEERTSLSFSVERASSDIDFTTSQFNSLPNSPTPDGAVNLHHEFSAGHIQLAAIVRSPAAYLPNGKNGSVLGWGVNLSGAIRPGGRDTLVYQGAYGAGYERYVNDTSGLGIDAALENAADPHLVAVPLTAAYGAYQHYWLRNLRSSAVYGFAQVQNTDLEPGSTYHQSNYSAANFIWNPFGSLNLGTEVLYGWLVEKSRARASDTRFMFSAKYNFIKTPESKR